MPHPPAQTSRRDRSNGNKVKITVRIIFRQALAIQLAKHLRVLPLFFKGSSRAVRQAIRQFSREQSAQNVLGHRTFKEDRLFIEIRGVQLVIAQPLRV